MFKKIITSVVLCATLASALAVPAVAGTIAGCTPGVDSLDEMLCSKLQSIYGTTSNIEFSKTETEVCKYSTRFKKSSRAAMLQAPFGSFLRLFS